MQTAILFFIASSVGISVGWQPMPDGSPRYEYVVQLDRELLATLKQGESMQGGSIPISSEVPDDIRPIARIRIVVGDENLPRQKLVTQFKPWPEGPLRGGPLREGPLPEGLVETQYVVPTGGANLNAANENSGNIVPRYQNQPILPADSSSRQILPPKSRPQSDGNSFGQALQRSAEQARNASTQGQILPPSKEIRPPSREIRPPQNNGRYAEPIQSANQKRGNQWRDTSASSQADIQQLFGPAPGERSRGNLQPVDERSIVTDNRYNATPSSSGPIIPRTEPILPPIGVPTSSVEVRSTNDPPTASSRYQQLDEPITADNSSHWNQSPPSPLSPSQSPPSQLSPSQLSSNGAPITSTSDVLNAPWPAPERFEDAPLAQAWNTRNQSEDRLASQPADHSHSSDWPKTETSDRTATDSQWPSSPPSSPPEIRREMLSHPANAELRTARGGPASTPRASSQPSPTLAPAPFPAPLPPQSNVIQQPQNAGPTGGSPSGSVFPLVLAWVLLSGSGAGNLYLFWSYLDIRNKYRGLNRTADRKLGRRSAEEEYDDEDYDE